MRVEFDDQIFVAQRHGGISRYFTELIREFDADSSLGVEITLGFRYTRNDHLLELDKRGARRLPVPPSLEKARILAALNRIRGTGPSPDIVHHTFYAPRAALPSPHPSVCTVYDMIPELFPAEFPEGNPHQAKKEVVLASDAVICISETTRRDLIQIYGDLDKPITVTHLAVSERFFRAYDETTSVWSGRPYVLFVGKRSSYKNFDVVLRAFASLANELPDLDLLCVGGGPFTDIESARLSALGVRGRTKQHSASETDLPGIYARALCFVFPSRYEGFGLPILEAMASGCPVIVADTACLVEVAQNAAERFNPDDDSALGALLATATTDSTWRAAARAKGTRHAAEFSWRKTAQNTALVYRSLLDQSRG